MREEEKREEENWRGRGREEGWERVRRRGGRRSREVGRVKQGLKRVWKQGCREGGRESESVPGRGPKEIAR